MADYASILTGGANSFQTTAEHLNNPQTDFISDGVVGAITNTAGVAPATGGLAVNAQGSPNMTVAVTAGQCYVTATPTGQSSQRIRANIAAQNVTIAANSTGSTRYDHIYVAISATNANTPSAAGDNVASVVASRSTSSATDNGTPPTYGYKIAVVTVVNGAASIANGSIADKRIQTGPNTLAGAVKASNNAGGTNVVTITGNATGTGPSIAPTGDDTNIDLTISRKGTGLVKLPAQGWAGLVRYRLGGAAGDASWATAGTTTVDTSAKGTFLQAGTTAGSGAGSVSVTFPTAFSQIPVVVAQKSTTGASAFGSVEIFSLTASGFSANTWNDAGGRTAFDFQWIAVGQ